ncbi:MAG: FAD-binding oxidoreductase [Albidovulum sp.]|uniref:NAD(P)/FAD-dependent oxidoreductase n=1 Tax=Albidovulum sp. TaxID=1872424 RepID=UPI003C86CBAC
MPTSGPSNLWRATSAEALDAPPLANDSAVDLAIVGGGFTGCSAALEAARGGATVALLEAETIGHGGSGRNVGLVNAGLWLPPRDVLKILGDADGTRLIKALSNGPDIVFDLIEREGIDCEPVRRGTIHLAHSAAGLKGLRARFEQGTLAGRHYELLDAADTAQRTGSMRFTGSLRDPGAGTIQPLAYCRGLARAAQIAGAELHEKSPVTSITRSGGDWMLEAAGHRVKAKALLIATNAYQTHFGAPFAQEFIPVHYSQFATVPMPDDLRARILPDGEGCWDTALIMSSFRTDRAGRLILGGIGNAEGAGARVHSGWARRKLSELYPDLAHLPFEHHWAGRIAMTSDHVPKIVAPGPSALAIFGYSGRGICPGTVFGMKAARALLGGTDGDLPLPVLSGHGESLTRAKAAWYEFGATATHAVFPHPLSRRQ